MLELIGVGADRQVLHNRYQFDQWEGFTPTGAETSLPVAVLGLVVNLASIRLLHGHEGHEHHEHEVDHEHEGRHHDDEHADDEHEGDPHAHGHGHRHAEHGHGHGHDHNHRAALLHVVADALTSVLASVALLAGRLGGYTWLDPAMGVVGGLVIV